METRKRFEQVFIKSEADLPRERTILIAHFKHSGRWTDLVYFNTKEDDIYWMSEVDYYLLPLEPAEVSEETEQSIKDKIEVFIDMAINFEYETYDRDCIDQIYNLFQSLSQVSQKTESAEEVNNIANNKCLKLFPNISDVKREYFVSGFTLGYAQSHQVSQVTDERRLYMRQQAITVSELTKGFTDPPKDKEVQELFNFVDYVLELTSDLSGQIPTKGEKAKKG